MFAEINENVDVIAVYEKGSVRPFRVKWRDRVYQVTEVFHQWREPVGNKQHIHVTVGTNMATMMELAVDPDDLSWRIVRTEIPG